MAKNNVDNELEVLAVVKDSLEQLDQDGRLRVVRYVSELFDLAIDPDCRVPSDVIQQVSSVTRNDREFDFGDRTVLPPKEFLHEKAPQTDIERVACLAYYLSKYRDIPHFKTIDISKLNTNAAQLKFSNPAAAVANATATGLLTPAGKGKKQVSAIGERFVDALPDRGAAKQALSRVRKRRTKKSTSKRKTSPKTRK